MTPQRISYRSPLRFLVEGVEGIVLLAFLMVTWPVARVWLLNWGSHPDERTRRWPGDEFVGEPDQVVTRAIDVAAPAESVWKWVVQFGLDRAGFYSYELLERLVGIQVINVESIVPTLQRLDVGDEIKLHPKSPGAPVASVELNRHICLAHTSEQDGEPPDPARSFSFYVRPTSATTCRLLVRSCIEPLRKPTLAKRLGLMFEGPIDFLMEQRMLRTITRLASHTPESESSKDAYDLNAGGVSGAWAFDGDAA